jgi:hypothetical protein
MLSVPFPWYAAPLVLVLWLPLAMEGRLAGEELVFPPLLRDGSTSASVEGDELLRIADGVELAEGVVVASEAPRVDLVIYPGQDYPGKPWSNWGEGVVAGGVFYSGIGDHLAPAGNAFLYAYREEEGELERLLDLRKLLALPEGHYSPGKFHTALGVGRDGWIYAATHRGSTRTTVPENHFEGDWIVRQHVEDGRSEIVVQAPVAGHCIPSGLLDPERLIYYGATVPGHDGVAGGTWFFAYDIGAGEVIYADADGPARGMALAGSSGRIYYVAGAGAGRLMRFDPAEPGGVVGLGEIGGLRAASGESVDGAIYFVDQGREGTATLLYRLDTADESVLELGPVAVGGQQYITSLAIDPLGKFLYYVPGAHGGAERDGSAVVQYDLRSGVRKVVAFLHPTFGERHGLALRGCYGVSISEDGDRLYLIWNASRGGKVWDCCALTVVHLPEGERR